jgi:hypothetical protein
VLYVDGLLHNTCSKDWSDALKTKEKRKEDRHTFTTTTTTTTTTTRE